MIIHISNPFARFTAKPTPGPAPAPEPTPTPSHFQASGQYDAAPASDEQISAAFHGESLNATEPEQEPTMAAAPVPQPTAVPVKQTFLQHFKGDFKKAFAWLGSTKGQAIIKEGETVAEDVFPQLTGAVNLLNTWGMEIITAEALGEAAGSAPGSDLAKSGMVIGKLTPQIEAFFQSQGKPLPAADKIQKISDDLVSAFKILSGDPTATAPKAA